MGLAPGTRLGSYQITGKLGEGGMGEVYRAHDTRLGRDVAIKALPGGFGSDRDRVARFEHEARMLASLNHPHIAAIYGVEEMPSSSADQAPMQALVLELVEGLTLADRLLSGPLPVSETLVLARQIADALDAAHEKGIIHRDLKPANIKVTPEGVVKVLDFGLAKLAVGTSSTGLEGAPTMTASQTLQGSILGTPRYMSPEQARGQTLDKRTDIWSFGCVVYELFTGRAAFAGATLSDTLAAILSRDPDWSALPESTPAPVQALLRRCLEKDRKRRLRDIGDAGMELEAAPTTPSTLPATRAAGLGPPALGAGGPSRRQILGGSAVALGVLGVGFGTGSLVSGRSRPAATPSYQRLTFRQGMIRTARFAPDYQTILYGALWEDDVCRTYSVRPESPASAPLNLPPAAPLAVSSSGEVALALGTHLRLAMPYGTLARVSLAGGAPREMLEAVKYADWSPDGGELAVVRRVDGRERLEYPIGNAMAEPASAAGGFSFPRVSPDGDRVAFFELPNASSLEGSVAVVDRRTGKKIVSPPYLNVFGLAWNGDEVWFTAAHERHLFRDAIHAMTVDGTTRVVWRMPGNVSLHDISPDGRVLMAHTRDRGGMTVLAPGESMERDLSWLDAPWLADISRDGSMILFTEYGVGSGPLPSVYLRSTTGSPAVRLGGGWAIALSPDGRWALALMSLAPSPYLDLLPAGAGQSIRIERAGFTYGRARWLPDGKRVMVWGQEQGRSPRLYVLDLDSRALAPITPEGVVLGERAVSPDGTMVAVASGSGIELYPVSGGEARPALGVTSQDSLIDWIEGGLLVTDDLNRASLRVFLVEPRSGRRELWREIVPRDPAGIMNVNVPRVTPDGRAYGYTWHRAISDLYLVDGLR